MISKEEFEEHKHWKQYWEKDGYKPNLTDEEQLDAEIIARYWSWKGWLEKGKRDRCTVMQAVDHVLNYGLPYIVERRLRELLEEMK